MSLRSILPTAALVLCLVPFATGCADSDDSSDESSETGGAAGAKESAAKATGANGAKAAPAPRVHEGPPPPAQQLPSNPTDFVAQRDAAVKSIVDGAASSDSVTSFVLDRGSDSPLIFRVVSSAVKAVEGGFEVHGNLTLETPIGPLSLFAADVVFERGDSGNLERLVGSVEIPAPSLGAFEGFETTAPIRGTIGYDLGKNLKTKLEAPMLDERKYLAFDYGMGLEAAAGEMEISFAGGKSGTMVLDPMDPSFYLTGSMLGLDQVGPFSDLAMGLSARGLLAFEPKITWGVEDEAKPFSGHIYAKGTVDLKRLPISIDGDIVVNVDPDGNGRLLGTGASDGVQIGANGQLNLSFDAKVASIKLPLAKATMGAKITSAHQHAYISGEIGPDVDWLPTAMPFIPQAQARVAAFVDSDLSKSKLRAEADFALKANKLYGVIPGLSSLNLKDIPVATATLSADQTGLRITGSVKSPSISFLKVQNSVAADAFLPANDPSAFYFTMSGSMSLADFPLGAATARIDKNGFAVSGTFKTPATEITMSGAINAGGATVDGKLVLDLAGLQSVLQTVTDGVVCGYDYTKDGAICGYEYVTDGTVCGYEYVTDGTVCGWDSVSSCIGGIFTGHGIDDCKTPKSCNIARTCQIAKGCNIPKTCQTHVQVPNVSFGRFEGQLHVAVTSGGVSASVAGALCSGGSCTTVGSAKVTLGAHPQVCFSALPNAIGDVCASF